MIKGQKENGKGREKGKNERWNIARRRKNWGGLEQKIMQFHTSDSSLDLEVSTQVNST